MPQIIPSKIAGIFMYPEAKPVMKGMANDCALSFEREPSNPHDANAIALYAEWAESRTGQDGSINANPNPPVMKKIKIGYIPKDQAAMMKTKKIISVNRSAVGFDKINIEVE